MKKEAVAYYESLIGNEHKAIDQLHTHLEAEMKAKKASFGERPLCPFLRPNFILAPTYDYIKTVVTSLMQAIAKIFDVAREVKAIRDQMDLSRDEEVLAKIDPGYQGFSVTSRIDSFLTDSSLQFVELNSETPAGLAYQDVLAKIFMTLPLMKEFTKKYKIHPYDVTGKLSRMLLEVYREFSHRTGQPPKENPTVAIVDWKNLPTQFEFEIIAEFLERQGIKTIITDPAELEYQDGRLIRGAFPIDIVYRRVVTSEFLEKFNTRHPLVQAYENHHVCVINHFRTKLTHKKMIFGLLSDEENHQYFSQSEIEIIKKHIPWTRRVRECKTTYSGRTVDLCRYIMDNKDKLVLKPNDKYGGKGIYIGWETGREEWEKNLKEALENSYVVQEKVQIAQESFPTYANGQLTYDPYIVDLDPYIFYGREVYGCLTRLSSSALCNVSSGGGQVPTFIIDRIA